MTAEDRLSELGLELPPAPQALASYVPVAVAGEFAYAAGQIPLGPDGAPSLQGKVGAEIDVPAGAAAARQCALQTVAALRAALGSLDRVARIVRVGVFVASAEGFTDQPAVANGASDLFVELFGEAGRHARAAVGVSELPRGAPVEVEVVAQISS